MSEDVSRWIKFNAVGVAGAVVQAGALASLLSFTSLDYLPATALAVEAAVLHNFVWHWKWTWADRVGHRVVEMLLKFHLTNGAVSLAGSLALMGLLVGAWGLHPFLANLVSMLCCALANFLLSDRWVFRIKL